eukprot:6199356-Pleurochrysis_carterae.AAC.6
MMFARCQQQLVCPRRRQVGVERARKGGELGRGRRDASGAQERLRALDARRSAADGASRGGVDVLL